MGLIWIGLLVPILSQARPSSGKEIYQRQCSKCHGKQGEGVAGKYKDPLTGDWSIDKLTRYIEKYMPDDHPGTCTGEEAKTVSRFIHDSFYSREAQARLHPARIELVRLTNRQYVNTVADLLRSFSGEDGPIGPERGLNATYYASRDFRNDRKLLERVEGDIHFDFLTADPTGKPLGTNELSAQWRGSILADESGDHEFVLKTGNGARLWINGNQEPVIDAWVASGEATEHKAVVRLIAGRAYPFRLDFFRFKDKTAAVSLEWKPPHGVRSVIPKRSLVPVQVKPTPVLSIPFPPDDSSVGYERGVGISKAWDEATTQAALEVGRWVVARLETLSGAKADATDRAEKVEAFLHRFVERAFRRPLTAEQRQVHVTAPLMRAAKLEEGVKSAVLLALKSPRFLYLGLERNRPDDYEVASRLSFGLWDSLPDAALRAAASAGQLHTTADIRQQAARMLGDPRSKAKMRYFLHHWLQVNQVEDLTKDEALFPGFTPEIIADLRTSLNVFLDRTVWSEASDYRDLLRSETLYLNGRLKRFYGIPGTNSPEFEPTVLDGSKRSGVITHPYLLAAFSYQRSSSPIHRGVFLTRNIVGRALRPPPMAVAFKDAEFAPNLTMREKVSELTRSDACQTCHSVINPLGFSLENFDAVGRFRTKDRDRVIDSVSEYVTDDGKSIRLEGARDIADFAVGSEPAQNGFIEQLFHQVVKQPMLAYGSDTVSKLRQSFIESGFNLRKLLIEIVTLSASHATSPTGPKKASS